MARHCKKQIHSGDVTDRLLEMLWSHNNVARPWINVHELASGSGSTAVSRDLSDAREVVHNLCGARVQCLRIRQSSHPHRRCSFYRIQLNDNDVAPYPAGYDASSATLTSGFEREAGACSTAPASPRVLQRNLFQETDT